jgi:D-glycero-D-manno-heptose 1,7-bisphosphate phosphatase
MIEVSMATRAVFLDRDGVINQPRVIEGRPYPPRTIAEFVLLPGVEEACHRLKTSGFQLVIVTNQPDVGRGTLERSVVEAIHFEMCRVLPIDRVEVCYDPGGEDPPSPFRKPRPGMLLRAAAELTLDLRESWMVGDRWRDIDAGHAAGCRTILIDYGYSETLQQPPDYRAASLTEAAGIILNASKTAV